MIATCSSTGIGEFAACFKISLNLWPLESWFLVAWSRSDANWEKASSSANCASLILAYLQLAS